MWKFLISSSPKENHDLHRFAWKHPQYDWKIARLVGVATYAQLLDVAPGWFEAFPDVRDDGDTPSSLSALFGGKGHDHRPLIPPPPNLISTLLVDGDLSIPHLRRLLIRALCTGKVDPRIEGIIQSSRSYRHPELALGEILLVFILLTILMSIIIGAVLQTRYIWWFRK